MDEKDNIIDLIFSLDNILNNYLYCLNNIYNESLYNKVYKQFKEISKNKRKLIKYAYDHSYFIVKKENKKNINNIYHNMIQELNYIKR